MDKDEAARKLLEGVDSGKWKTVREVTADMDGYEASDEPTVMAALEELISSRQILAEWRGQTPVLKRP